MKVALEQPAPRGTAGVAPAARPASRGARVGAVLAAGALLGAVDGALALHLAPAFAGGLGERYATMGIAVAGDALLFALVALAVRPLAGVAARFAPGCANRWHATLVAFASAWLAAVMLFEEGATEGRVDLSRLEYAAAGLGIAAALAAAVFALVPPLARAVGLARAATPTAALAAALALAAPAVGFGVPAGPAGPAAPPDERPLNVLLVSLDTLRADHLSCYGYDRETSPALDALAGDGVLFQNATSASHWTLPAHAAMLTGLDPLAVDVVQRNDHLHPRVRTLAERLRERGYRTGALVGNGPYSYIGGRRGFEQGFEEYRHRPYPAPGCRGLVARTASKAWWRYVDHRIGTATNQVDHARRWLRARQGEPFFLFLHLFDVHSDSHRLPYEAPEPFRDRFDPDYEGDFTGCHPSGLCASELLTAMSDGRVPERFTDEEVERMRALYDGGIAYTDHELGRLLDELRALGLYERTLVVVTSDHGEAFFEHDVPLHLDLYQENLHVPLVVRAPGVVAGTLVPDVVHTVDVPATILDLAGIEVEQDAIQGKSLAPFLFGEQSGEHGFAYSFGEQEQEASVRAGPWKLIRGEEGAPDELYRVDEDPREQASLLEREPDKAAKMRGALEAREAQSRALQAKILGDVTRDDFEIPPGADAEMRAIGYGGDDE